jgi:hypothetical protein
MAIPDALMATLDAKYLISDGASPRSVLGALNRNGKE